MGAQDARWSDSSSRLIPPESIEYLAMTHPITITATQICNGNTTSMGSNDPSLTQQSRRVGRLPDAKAWCWEHAVRIDRATYEAMPLTHQSSFLGHIRTGQSPIETSFPVLRTV